MSENFFIPDQLTIIGGTPCTGSVHVSGAKNSILPLMAASLLTDEKVTLRNVPYISDVMEMGHILKELGVKVQYSPQEKILILHAEKIKSNVVSHRAAKFRSSYYLWGALLARFCHTGEFDSLKVCMPGGCSFGGKRPTDFHEQLIKNIFGAAIDVENDAKHAFLSFNLPQKNPKKLCPIYTTTKVSHGATCHWLLSVAGSHEIKMMYNSSLEPEISNLISMLQQMGLGLTGSERTGLVYDGTNKRLLKGVDFNVVPDRLEAATYALLSLATKGEIELDGINYEHCLPWISQLSRMFDKGIYFSPDLTKLNLDFRNRKKFGGVIMQMSPFPGNETDLQQIWTPVLAQADSPSIISDIIWPGRQAHLPEMEKFGLKAKAEIIEVISGQQTAMNNLYVNIKPSRLTAAQASGTDLRGTMGLIVLAASAAGTSKIDNPGYALRGYPNLIDNFNNLGIKVSSSKKGEEIKGLPGIK